MSSVTLPTWQRYRIVRGTPSDVLDLHHIPGVVAVNIRLDRVDVQYTGDHIALPSLAYRHTAGRVVLVRAEGGAQ
jgi:hypothetical protein